MAPTEKDWNRLRERQGRFEAFAKDVRTTPLEFWKIGSLAELTCPCCGAKYSHLSTYPFHDTGRFARQVLVWCGSCGFGAAPKLKFDLDAYYAQIYASENRGDRETSPEVYYSKANLDNPPPNLKRYFGRARRQIDLIKERRQSFKSFLDVGAGPGYALYLSEAEEKYALEFDESSSKYLSYIGAELVTWDNVPERRYDVILMSHVLEHFRVEDVIDRLTVLKGAMREDGLVYIEVPPGGLGWKHYEYKHEPHTLFFTSEALEKLCRSVGFDVVFCGPLNNSSKNIHGRKRAIYEPPEQHSNPRGAITAICKLPSGRLD